MQPPDRIDHLNQPELNGPDGIPLVVPDDLAIRLWDDILDSETAGGGFSPLGGMTESGKKIALEFSRSIRHGAREHLRVFDTNGLEHFRSVGDEDSVAIEIDRLRGNVAVHNHPQGTPPSLKDLVVAIQGGCAEIHVSSAQYSYFLRVLTASRGELVSQWNYLDSMSFAVGTDWRRSQTRHMEDREIVSRRLHALLMELARKGLILYIREVNV